MNDADLYIACMKFCEAYTKVLIDKEKLHHRELFFDEYGEQELEKRIELEEKWLKKRFVHLCKVVDDLKG